MECTLYKPVLFLGAATHLYPTKITGDIFDL